MNKTAISYLDRAWNPVTGCSCGCPECWARPMAYRFGKSFEPTFHPDKLDQPAKRKKPATVGVCFTGDLFDPQVQPKAVDLVFETAYLASSHDYVFLTKRADRMVNQCKTWRSDEGCFTPPEWFYMGVTVRNQAELDAAAPHILAMAGAGWKVWLSIEPMQGQISFETHQKRLGGYVNITPFLSGVILGGQSGPNAPPLNVDWVRAVRDQCAAAGVPFMFKQWGDGQVLGDSRERRGPAAGLSRVSFLQHDANRKFIASWPVLDGRTHTALAWPLHEKVLP